MRFLFQVTILCIVILGKSPSAFADLAYKAQDSIVYIFFDVTDPKTGDKITVRGTGVIVSPLGHVLTASHLFRDWKRQNEQDKKKNVLWASLRDKPDRVPTSPMKLDDINLGDPNSWDVALLKLPELHTPEGYRAATVCPTYRPEANADIFAFGFPEDQPFQMLRGHIGNTSAPGGRWTADIDFADGMSGGPVYDLSDNVVGLVKGGLGNIKAVRWITPIGYAENFLSIAGATLQCDRNPTWNAYHLPSTPPEPMPSDTKPVEPIKVFETKVVEPMQVQIFNKKDPIPYVTIKVNKAISGEFIAKGNTDKKGYFTFEYPEQ